MIRIEGGVRRGPPVSIAVIGPAATPAGMGPGGIGPASGQAGTDRPAQVPKRLVEAHEGESVAAALLAAGITTLRRSPRKGAPRGAFCMMGSCQECVVRIDGMVVQACMEPVRAGMEIELG